MVTVSIEVEVIEDEAIVRVVEDEVTYIDLSRMTVIKYPTDTTNEISAPIEANNWGWGWECVLTENLNQRS